MGNSGMVLLLVMCVVWLGCARVEASAPSPVSSDFSIRLGAGQTVECRDADGQLVASGTDASDIIQQAIDKLPVNGGRIYISAGTYEITKTIHAESKHGVHIEGAGRGILFTEIGGTLLKCNKDIDVLQIGNASGITLNNFHITGSGAKNGKAGILAVSGHIDVMSLQNIGVNNCGIGIHLSGRDGLVDATMLQFCDPQLNGIGLKIERAHYVQIVGGQYTDCLDYGIVITSPDEGFFRTQGVKISSITAVRDGKAGVFIGKNTEDTSITGGSDLCGSEGSGVVISDEDGTGRRPKNILITGCQIYNNGVAGVDVKNADYVLINSNIISNHNHIATDPRQRYGIRLSKGTGTVVMANNIEYGNRECDLKDERKQAKQAIGKVLFDFNEPSLKGWKITGDAWGVGDASTDKFHRSGKSKYFADSLANGEAKTGTITSPPFTITGKTLTFLAGGWMGCGRIAADPSKAKNMFYLKMAKTGKILRTGYPVQDTVDLEPVKWDVSDLAGKEVVFEAVDGCSDDGYAWIAFDHVVIEGS